MEENYKERCKDCAYLIKAYNGEWVCDAFEEYCKDLVDCVNIIEYVDEECENEEIL